MYQTFNRGQLPGSSPADGRVHLYTVERWAAGAARPALRQAAARGATVSERLLLVTQPRGRWGLHKAGK